MNTATQSQTRRSRKRSEASNAQSERMKAYWAEKKNAKHPEEDPRFPGFHTCAVARINPHDPKGASPVGEYEAMDYKVISEDPRYTGHGDRVLMGIPIDKYEERERERHEYHNGLLEGFGPSGALADLPGQAGGDAQVHLVKDKSGLHVGDKISLAEAAESLRPSEEAND